MSVPAGCSWPRSKKSRGSRSRAAKRRSTVKSRWPASAPPPIRLAPASPDRVGAVDHPFALPVERERAVGLAGAVQQPAADLGAHQLGAARVAEADVLEPAGLDLLALRRSRACPAP
jgi:hypothetical protein